MADQFCDQLKELREKYKGGQACVDELDETIESLKNIKRTLQPNKNAVVQISNTAVLYHTHLSVEYFQMALNNAFKQAPVTPRVVNFYVEDNFKLENAGTPAQLFQKVQEAFLALETDEQAAMMLGMKTLNVPRSRDLCSVTFQFFPVSQPAIMRQNLRTIANGIYRLKAIKLEYERMGVKLQGENGPPVLSDVYLDKSFYSEQIEEMKKRRKAGEYGYHDRALLLGKKPVDTASLQARVAKLYDEEMDILIKLRQFQIEGIVFDF